MRHYIKQTSRGFTVYQAEYSNIHDAWLANAVWSYPTREEAEQTIN